MSRAEPALVIGIEGVTQIDTGTLHTCAVRRDGSVWCWGSNVSGVAAPNDRRPRLPGPVRVEGVEGP